MTSVNRSWRPAVVTFPKVTSGKFGLMLVDCTLGPPPGRAGASHTLDTSSPSVLDWGSLTLTWSELVRCGSSGNWDSEVRTTLRADSRADMFASWLASSFDGIGVLDLRSPGVGSFNVVGSVFRVSSWLRTVQGSTLASTVLTESRVITLSWSLRLRDQSTGSFMRKPFWACCSTLRDGWIAGLGCWWIWILFQWIL